jgi:DEAD/DEAH box helicase domain-containing protein
MSLSQLLSRWRADSTLGGNIVDWRLLPERRARLVPFPEDLHPALSAGLETRGMQSLYIHQAEVWDHVCEGNHVVVATGTASGKTLCYNLPVLDRLLRDPEARGLYIFPTKALAQDQKDEIKQWIAVLGDAFQATVATYDGDTPRSARKKARAQARFILTNPDMLHTGILPYHTKWVDFFANLRFVVVDEIHTYRGVFGSHVANVIRRLKRIARFYGVAPQFILTSATIANPIELSKGLLEEHVILVDKDGSQRGPRQFLLYNPPIVDADLGIRAGVLQESVRLVDDLLISDIQTILFCRTRRNVEIAVNYLYQKTGLGNQAVRGYRSGYLPAQRREIESGLRSGVVRGVAATNALELGVDIGGMGAVVMAGYPGTIAATLQQAGRAGRSVEMALALLVASANPLDQFLMRHPDYLFSRSPEQALINPNNLLILLSHILCSSFELPFSAGESFGDIDFEQVLGFLEYLEESEVLYSSGDKYFWMADEYPAASVSLRSASPDSVALYAREGEEWFLVGDVDIASAKWMVHPGAIYLHEGRSYLIDELIIEDLVAYMHAVDVDFYTQPRRQVTVVLLKELDVAQVYGVRKAYGQLSVTTKLTGYYRVQWYTHQRLGVESIDLPPSELQTTGYWMSLDADTVEDLQVRGLWKYEPNKYGSNWEKQKKRVRERDNHICQVCGVLERDRAHDVHHKVPFRSFASYKEANHMRNLITLCRSCHQRAETVVRIRSGLAGLAFVLSQLAPLFLMCDSGDLGVHADPHSDLADGQPTVVIYEQIPAGIGMSERLFELHEEMILRAYETVSGCSCKDGCPSCVGPGGELGSSGKRETLAILKSLNKHLNR